MKIIVEYSHNNTTERVSVTVSSDEYTLKVKELLGKSENIKISDTIREENGPYSPSIRLSFKGIELNNMFRLDKYGIAEGNVLSLFIGGDKAADAFTGAAVPKDNKTCTVCGKKVKDPEELLYHTGTISPQEWVYGLTVNWKWSCCGKIVSTPDSCFHPRGCASGICPECRKDCPCHQARQIRRQEEEDF